MYSTFKRLLLIVILSLLFVHPVFGQDTPTPQGEPTAVVTDAPTAAVVTATPDPLVTPVPEPPPVEPAPEPLPPFFDLTEIVLTVVAVAALVLVGLDRREFQKIANTLLNAPPEWLVTLFLDFANRGFDEATRKAGTTPTPIDDESVRLLREEFQRIIDEWRSGLPAVVVQAIATEVARQSGAQNAPHVTYPPHNG